MEERFKRKVEKNRKKSGKCETAKKALEKRQN